MEAYRWCRHIANLWFLDSTPSECCSSVVIGEFDKDEKLRKNNILYFFFLKQKKITKNKDSWIRIRVVGGVGV